MVNKEKEKQIVRHLEKTAGMGHSVLTAICIVIGIYAAVASAYTGWQVVGWANSHTFTLQSPIIFRTPLVIGERKTPKRIPIVKDAGASAVLAKEDPKVELYERMYDTVHFYESTRGTNKTGLNGYCLSLGGVNQIGFAPYESHCFKNVQEQKETFMLWVKNRHGVPCVKTGFCRGSVEELLSLYSSGAYSELLAQN